jgi:hypothetical protein
MPGPNSKGKGTNPYATVTSALGQKSSKKRKNDPPKKDAPAKKKKTPAKKLDNAKLLPVINLDTEVHQRGDDERRAGGGLRAAPPANLHDFKTSVDPSSPTNEVPQNDPVQSTTEHPAAAAIQEDGNMAMMKQRQMGDEISAVTDATKRMGATLPSGHNLNASNLMLQSQLALIQQSNTKSTIKEGKDTASSSPAGAEAGTPAAGSTAKGSEGPTQSPLAPQQSQRAAQNDTLRPLFGMANPLTAIPSTRDQIKSGILFNDFHIVAPGHGLGATNKMFLMEELRESNIRYRGPLAFPRADIGPTNTVLPPPLEWQNSIAKADYRTIMRQKKDSIARKQFIEELAGTGSANILGDDYGLLRDTSAKGLPRPQDEPFEPVILKPTPMERVRLLSGSQLEDRQFRRLFDAERYPEHFNSHIGQEGGSHYGRRSALKLLPYVVGTA